MKTNSQKLKELELEIEKLKFQLEILKLTTVRFIQYQPVIIEPFNPPIQPVQPWYTNPIITCGSIN